MVTGSVCGLMVLPHPLLSAELPRAIEVNCLIAALFDLTGPDDGLRDSRIADLSDGTISNNGHFQLFARRDHGFSVAGDGDLYFLALELGSVIAAVARDDD